MDKKAFWEAAGDVLISLGVTAAFQEFVKKWGEHAKKQFDERVTNLTDLRAELLEDIRRMSVENREPKNLIRRHKAAIADHTENRFVALLCKIPNDPGNPEKGRQDMLQYLDGLDDEQFYQMLDLLEDYLTGHEKEVREKIATEAKRAGEMIAKKTADGVAAAESSLKKSGDWLEQREQERKNKKMYLGGSR